MNIDANDFLPQLTCNKNYIKKKKYLKRKRKAELEREQKINKLSSGERKKKKARKDSPDINKKKVKVRKPKTVVSGVKTGKETLLKKKAKALVQETKAKKKLKKVSSIKAKSVKSASEKPSSKKLNTKQTGARKANDTPRDPKTRASHTTPSSIRRKKAKPLSLSPDVQTLNSSLTIDELDHVLIEQTIRGQDYAIGEEPFAQARNFVREDPTLYPPEIAFCEDLAEEKEGEDLTEDALLDNAHRYFKELNAKEQQINQSAAAYLKKMRAINHRGGDKDGFRYVLPSSVKQVARQMMLASSAAATNENKKVSSLAMVDTTPLDSTFNGDGERLTEKKPVRSRRRRPSTFSDFYKFQVSKRWTQNAESFLNRGRVNKTLFEAKKHQRNIWKL
ncbi:unnamed protein product [Phytomonas sp. Hart1]|nr:unnamed protein product [Phytomonas sp. Hart1]|eukprot:CCW69448.1 unnamed protein product [Phytomonas sp. isolate Hart1]